MSLSVDPVPVLVTDDPRIDLDPHPYYLVERGASDIIYQNYNADSFGGGTINITTQISDRRTVVSSKVFIRPTFQVTVTANRALFTAGAADTLTFFEELTKGNIAPRFSPLMSATTNCSININGKQFNQPVGRYFTPLMKYCVPTETAFNDFSTFPSFQDILQEQYNFQASPPTVVGIAVNVGSNLSAVGTGEDDTIPYNPSKRAGWLSNVGYPNAPSTDTTLTFTFTTEEILPLSPLIWGHKEVKGISGIDTLNLYLNYDSNLLNASIMTCIQKTPADLLVTFTSQVTISACSAEFIYFSPRANVEIPPVLRYRYNNIQHIPKNMPAPTGSVFYNPDNLNVQSNISTFYSDSITLQGMPKRMYIFIRRQQQAITSQTTDTYARIDKISLQIGNRSGILSEATPQALYRMAVKNGYQGSWDLWYNNCGSVLCIDFAQDIPLGLLEAPGTLSKLNLQYSVSGQNLYYDRSAAATAYVAPFLELNTVIVYDGMVIIKDGQVIIEQSDVSPLDVANSNKIHHVHYDDLSDFAGGSFTGGAISKYLSSVKRGFSKVKELAQKALPYVEKYGPAVVSAAAKAAPVLASLLAAGYTENEIYAMMEGKTGAKGKKGGARAPKKALKARAIKY